jgi:hypothetical protein
VNFVLYICGTRDFILLGHVHKSIETVLKFFAASSQENDFAVVGLGCPPKLLRAVITPLMILEIIKR